MVCAALALATCAAADAAATAGVVRVVGHSVRGRPIRAYVNGDPAAPRRVLVVACLHGDEPAGAAVTRRLRAPMAPRGVALWLVDAANPDGCAAGTRQNARGVDLNRNFPWRWRRLERPGGTYYAGRAPLSEPESRAIRRLVRRIRPAVSIYYHQHARMVDDSGGDPAFGRRYARLVGLPFRRYGFLPGVITGWQNAAFPSATAFVVELPAGRLSAPSGARHADAVLALARGLRPVPAAAHAAGRLRGVTVALDPGHNGANGAHPELINRLVDAGGFRKACDTTGTRTVDGRLTESAFNLDVARRLRARLRAQGARVVMTRQGDRGVGPCIDERAAIGNRARATVALSIHADGGPPAGRGFHVIYRGALRGSRRLALLVRGSLRRAGLAPADYTGADGLAGRTDLGGLNRSTVPKAFVELGNMRNGAEAARLERPAWRERAARALARALTAFCGR